MKKIIFFMNLFIAIFYAKISLWAWPEVVCNWLPWCANNAEWWTWKISELWFFEFIWKIISEWIKYVAVISVIAIVIAWIRYILSWWDDQKVKSAKHMIIWSLVWVVLSVWSWAIVNLVNSFSIK